MSKQGDDKVILQALERYYQILSCDEKSGISPLGYSFINVSFALNISKGGELLEVIPLKQSVERGKKTVEVPQQMILPERVKKTVNKKSNFLCENSSYALGVDSKGNPENSKECFEKFKELHNEVLSEVSCPEANAILNFVNRWDCEKAAENPVLMPHLKELLKGGNIVFKLDGGGYLHKNPQIRKAWENHCNSQVTEKKGQCLVTGEISEIARLHPNIKGVRGGQMGGGSLVSFNKSAYESYGRDKGQGYNAPVSKNAAFAYGTALNYLLASKTNKIDLGGTTVVFWAETSNPQYNLFASFFANPPAPQQKEEFSSRRDSETESLVHDYLKKVMTGLPAKPFEGVDENTNFFIMGLSPNASRLSVRFFVKDSFGGYLEKVTKHYKNMQIQKSFDSEWDIIPIWKLLSETVSSEATEKTASPLLAGSVLRAILTGSPYPAVLYQALLLRVKTEHDVTYVKAAGIKACLIKNNNKMKEVLTVALNEENKDTAYLLGRLFAVLEKTQQDAADGKLNSTIKDKYFSTACSCPATVFPVLLSLAQNHISKADYGRKDDNEIGKIINQFEAEKFPRHLTLDEQGEFMIGYYQQKCNPCKPSKNNKEENNNG